MRKRWLWLICSFLAIYLVNFLIPRLMPGDPFRYTSSVSGDDLDAGYSAEQVEQLRAYYRLDEPLAGQLLDSTARALRGDLGDSIYYKKPVAEVLAERLPWSLGLMAASLAVSLTAGTLFALWAARRRNADRVLYPVCSVLAEVPAFLLGVLLLFLVAARVKWIPLSGGVTPFARYTDFGEQFSDLLIHALMPLCAMVLAQLPQFFFTARACFLAELEKPYLLAARAKGLREGRIRFHYLLKNSAAALVARLFLSVSTAVGATLLVENVFAYPGVGRVLREAVAYRDFPMIQGVFLISSLLVLLCLFLADRINGDSAGGAGGCRAFLRRPKRFCSPFCCLRFSSCTADFSIPIRPIFLRVVRSKSRPLRTGSAPMTSAWISMPSFRRASFRAWRWGLRRRPLPFCSAVWRGCWRA